MAEPTWAASKPCMSSANLFREEWPEGTGEIGTRYTFSHQLVMCPPADDLLGVNLHIYYIYSLSLSGRRGGAQRWGMISQDRPLKQMATSHSFNLAIAEERGNDTHPQG